MRSGLDIFASHSESLGRFMQAYARLARLPQPTVAPAAFMPLVHRVVSLEPRLPVQILAGPELTLSCGAAQIGQVVINLIKTPSKPPRNSAPKVAPMPASVLRGTNPAPRRSSSLTTTGRESPKPRISSYHSLPRSPTAVASASSSAARSPKTTAARSRSRTAPVTRAAWRPSVCQLRFANFFVTAGRSDRPE